MTPDQLAALHVAAFTTPRPWSAAEFASLLAEPSVFVIARPDAFIVGRVVVDEAEILTIAVASAARRQGIGAGLISDFAQQAAKRGATHAFLEVAADNTAALALYAKAGFAPVGRRRGYFHTPQGRQTDALVMSRSLEGVE